MKTIAQQLNIKKFPFTIKDDDGKTIYYYEGQDGFWSKYEYDSNGNHVYYECSIGYWVKYEYDSDGNKIYIENPYGVITDKRPKSCEGKVVEIDGVKYKLTKL